MDLIAWFDQNHIKWSDNLSIKPSKLGGSGVFATSLIPEDTVLLSVPKAVILSPKTCGISNLLNEIDTDPMQRLVLAYFFEKNQPGSPWRTFIDSVQQVPLPDVARLWPQTLKEKLSHCDINFNGGLDDEQFQQGYLEAAGFFEELGIDVELSDYTDAILRVSSRAFDIDNFHELALVPGACLFNHSDTNSARFETDGTVCDLCGSVACGCKYSDEESDEEEEEEEDTPVSDSESLMSNDSIASRSSVDLSNVCEIRTTRAISPGAEIFNTYGEDGNSAMLGRYGFVVPHNKHEILDLTRDVFQYAKRHSLRDRYTYWKKNLHEFVEQEGVDPHDVLFVCNGEVSEAVVFVASIFSLGTKEYAKFVRTGEYNLKSEDKVVEILGAILSQRLENYRDGDLSSATYFEQAATLDGREQIICQLVGTEKELLERALEDVNN